MERAFSCGRHTVSLYRHSLCDETIQASLVFGNRCVQGLVNDEVLLRHLHNKRMYQGRPVNDDTVSNAGNDTDHDLEDDGQEDSPNYELDPSSSSI